MIDKFISFVMPIAFDKHERFKKIIRQSTSIICCSFANWPISKPYKQKVGSVIISSFGTPPPLTNSPLCLYNRHRHPLFGVNQNKESLFWLILPPFSLSKTKGGKIICGQLATWKGLARSLNNVESSQFFTGQVTPLYNRHYPQNSHVLWLHHSHIACDMICWDNPRGGVKGSGYFGSLPIKPLTIQPKNVNYHLLDQTLQSETFGLIRLKTCNWLICVIMN